VRSWTEREEAERAAWRAPGIAKVDNRISIECGQSHQHRMVMHACHSKAAMKATGVVEDYQIFRDQVRLVGKQHGECHEVRPRYQT
jgi:hypothetical protein